MSKAPMPLVMFRYLKREFFFLGLGILKLKKYFCFVRLTFGLVLVRIIICKICVDFAFIRIIVSFIKFNEKKGCAQH